VDDAIGRRVIKIPSGHRPRAQKPSSREAAIGLARFSFLSKPWLFSGQRLLSSL
jgi:hypothetical protein